MHIQTILRLVGLVVVFSVLATWSGECQEQQKPERQLPKLFDFQNYKQVFGKVYKSFGEELSRRRLVMARALRAFVSGIKYKFRQSNSYLALNHLSDKTEEERERRTNRVMARQSKKLRDLEREEEEPKVEDKKPELPELLPDEQEDVEGVVSDYLRQHGHELGLDAGGSRQKRDAPLEPRDFSLDQLINAPDTSAKPIRVRVESNNPNYTPIEVASFGLSDQQEEVTWIDLEKADKRSIEKQLSGALGGVSKSRSAKSGDDELQDLMYVDHRECMTPPRDQGDCGSCYAFSAMTMMEWLYCTKMNVRNVTFSEQYMVDCGNGFYSDEPDTMNGCEGAADHYVALFMHNFGLELLSNYPYRARNGTCPYDESYDLSKTGYIRMHGLDRAAWIPRRLFHSYILHGPINIGIARKRSFYSEYGGGLVEADDCGPDFDHAVVLVGYGRQEGRDYYIIRNAYGTDWGEGGYMKVARDATVKCLGQFGSVFGTVDGVEFPVRPRKTRN